jgi:hypothetical protein
MKTGYSVVHVPKRCNTGIGSEAAVGGGAAAPLRMPHSTDFVAPGSVRVTSEIPSLTRGKRFSSQPSSPEHAPSSKRDKIHSPTCWREPGHEQCALRAAALHAEQRAAYLRSASPTPEAVKVAYGQLGYEPTARQARRGVPKRPGSRVGITDDQASLIRDLWKLRKTKYGRITHKKLAEYFAVSERTIRNIIESCPQEPARVSFSADEGNTSSVSTHRLPPQPAPLRDTKDPAA